MTMYDALHIAQTVRRKATLVTSDRERVETVQEPDWP